LKAPKIALLSGKGVGSTEFGAVWFYLDEVGVVILLVLLKLLIDWNSCEVQHFDFSGWLL
jgi:hypothetical protein